MVIKNNDQYYRYPIKSTPFEYLLDKEFLLKKIKSSEVNEIENKFLFFQINENNNNINVFLAKPIMKLLAGKSKIFTKT